jgi:prenyltransferase beta subunit
MNEAVDIESSPAVTPAAPDEYVAKLDYTIDRAQRALLDLQKPEGYWIDALEANGEMNAEFIIFSHFMDNVDTELEPRLIKHLLERQNADGSWSIYPGADGHLSTTIEAYFALKLAGLRPVDEHRILRHARALLPRRDGPAALEGDGGRSDRDRAFPRLVLLQHLRAVVMGAWHADGVDVSAGGTS